MIIDENSFHESQILNVTENSSEQIIDLLLSFPTDWENSVFENKILRFENVVLYHVEQIPFAGLPTILNIVNLGVVKKDFGSGKNEWKVSCNKIRIETNAGNRIIEFSDCSLINSK